MAHRLIQSAKAMERCLRRSYVTNNLNLRVSNRNVMGAPEFIQTPVIQFLLEQVQYFCKKPPKGFEKYFEEGKSVDKKRSDSETSKSKESKSSVGKETSSSTSSTNKSDWSFGMFTNSSKGSQENRGTGGGGGRPIGEGSGGDREKWILFGGLSAVALLASIAFFEMGYKEISWKEFVNKYVLLLCLIICLIKFLQLSK